MKCYVELPCDNVKDIAEQIYQYVKEKGKPGEWRVRYGVAKLAN